MNYKELLNIKNKSEITYSELLELDEWKTLRNRILMKDKEKCVQCGSGESKGPLFSGSNKMWLREIGGQLILEETRNVLEIHHKYYIRNLLPWEYEDALITLCSDCHVNIHKTEKIPIYFDYSLTQEIHTEPCKRCGGIGFLSEYKHYMRGVCFGCQGTGFIIPWNDK